MYHEDTLEPSPHGVWRHLHSYCGINGPLRCLCHGADVLGHRLDTTSSLGPLLLQRDERQRAATPITGITALCHINIGIIVAPTITPWWQTPRRRCWPDQTLLLLHQQRWRSLDATTLNFPLDTHRPWHDTTVIAHDNKLIYMGGCIHGYSLLPLIHEESGVLHVSLPKVFHLPGGAVHKQRCVQLSCGKIRFLILKLHGAWM